MYHDENNQIYHDDVTGSGNTDEAVVIPVSCGFGRVMNPGAGYATTQVLAATGKTFPDCYSTLPDLVRPDRNNTFPSIVI